MEVVHHFSLQCTMLYSLRLLLFLALLLQSTGLSHETTTLREYLTAQQSDGTEEGIYLAMGPAFFGFFGYFGALAGMEDELLSSGRNPRTESTATAFTSSTSLLIDRKLLRGVSGASAGAMAATLLAAGISPHLASEFVNPLDLSDFADPGGVGGVMKGDRFESLMVDFLRSSSPIVNGNATCTNVDANTTKIRCSPPQWQLGLEDALVPVAVSTVDLYPQIASSSSPTTETLWCKYLLRPWNNLNSIFVPTAKILMQGSMARAARASACFPGLFQPVGWIDRGSSCDNAPCNDIDTSYNRFSLLIDGGLIDWAGCNGLKEIISTTVDSGLVDIADVEKTTPPKKQTRVLNMVVGGFGPAPPPGPEELSKTLGTTVDSVFSLSIVGLPRSGPLSMQNGRLANGAARRAVRDAIDRPVIASDTTREASRVGGNPKEQYHFVLEIDASSFVDTTL